MLNSVNPVKQALIILIIIAYLGSTSLSAQADDNGAFSGSERSFWIAAIMGGTIGLTSLAYYVYKNSPSQRARGYPPELGQGEWYIGGYAGLSYLSPTDWNFNGTFPTPYGGRTTNTIKYEPGSQLGIKFGRFLDLVPWFGIEVEANFSRNPIQRDCGRISSPVSGEPVNLLGRADWLVIWALQTNFIARYGLLQDKEVTFGRLQPYLGFGPGLEIISTHKDSSKHLSIETLAGLRYMCTPKIAIFFEYKFGYMVDVEYENAAVVSLSGGGINDNGQISFNVPHHRFVFGVSYHFKNLWGS